jgi:hypothetical protein
MWQDWTNGILGLAIIAVAIYGYGVTGAALGWTFGILGALIAVVGFWGVAALPEGTARHA